MNTHWRTKSDLPLCNMLSAEYRFSLDPTCKTCRKMIARRVLGIEPLKKPDQTHYPELPCGSILGKMTEVRRGKPTCKRCLRIGPKPRQTVAVRDGRVVAVLGPDQPAPEGCERRTYLSYTKPKIGDRP